MEVKIPSQKIMSNFSFLKLLPIAISLLVAVFYYPTITTLFERWIKWDEGLSHGLIVVGLFLLLQIKNSPWVITKNSAPLQSFLLLTLAGLSASWLLFHIVNLYIFEQLILLPILCLSIATIFGLRTCIKQLPLLLILIFSIPVWDQLSDTLVNMSSLVVGNMVRIIDMPAVIDGNSIFIPSGHIVIADGCSGLRYFVIALTLGYIISYLNHYTAVKTLVVLAIAAVIGLLANWLRIFILVIIGYETEMQSSLMHDHEYFGWFLFALISFPAIYFAPIVRQVPTDASSLFYSTPKLVMPILLLALGPAINSLIDLKPKVAPLTDLLSQELQPISTKRMPIPVLAPAGAKTENVLTAQNTYVQIDQYQRLTETDKLVPYMTRLYDNQYWTMQESAAVQLTNNSASLSLFRNKTTQRNIAQLQWLNVAGTTTKSTAIAKLLQIPALISGKNHFMIITVQAVCDINSCDDAKTAVIDTANSLSLHPKDN